MFNMPQEQFMKTLAISGALVAPASAAGEIKCSGINSCKGHSECNTANSSCKGQNSCKGQGWLPTASADECTAKGGKVITG
jgi:hypothetical protein